MKGKAVGQRGSAQSAPPVVDDQQPPSPRGLGPAVHAEEEELGREMVDYGDGGSVSLGGPTGN